ncbi:MAG: hypothetical protein U1E39_10315 [Planctomycetota bacterium]
MSTARPLTLRPTARAVGVPASWLAEEAKAGRIPCLQIGRRRLFNVVAVRRAVLERAGEPPRLRALQAAGGQPSGGTPS